MSQLKVEKIPNLTLGAVVTGVNLAQLDDPTWTEIEAAFHEHAVLVFPGQHLSSQDQEVFASRFGVLEHLIKDKDSYNITNTRKDGTVVKEGEKGWVSVTVPTLTWHKDGTFLPVASKMAMLQALTVPKSGGGQTAFADMRAGYDALDSEMKKKVDNMYAYHSIHYSQAKLVNDFGNPTKGLGVGYGYDGDAKLRPLVKKHPVTGRLGLFGPKRHAFGIPGMGLEESEKFLDDLTTFACQYPRVYEHDWKVGDLVIWDNRCIMHRKRPHDDNESRIMLGCRVAGDPETDTAIFDTPDAQRSKEVLHAELDRLRTVTTPVMERARIAAL